MTMLAAEHAPLADPRSDGLAELVEAALALRGGSLERHLLAATLKALAAWLNEQSALLGDTATTGEAATDHAAPNVRLLPSGARRPESILTPRERDVACR